MVSKRQLSLAFVVLIAASASGCAAQDIDWEMEASDAAGTWRLDRPDVGATLTLDETGDVVATDWPAALCEPFASSMDEIDWSKRVTFEGTYSYLEDFYKGYVASEDSICTGVSFYFWKGADGSRWIQLYLIPEDGSEPDEFVRLDLAP